MKIRMLLLLLALWLVCGAVTWADLAPWTAHSTLKVRPYDAPEDWGDPHIYSAKNEWEAVQVIVRDGAGEALTGCNVTVAPLEGPGDDISGIYLYREAFVEILSPSRKPADPAVKGWWPDGMIPFEDFHKGEDRSGAPFDVEAGWNQPIWIDIYVPEGQAAGEYSSAIVVSCDDKAEVSIPLTLTVWDFELPNAITLPSNYGYSCSTAHNTHQAMGGITGREELTQMYYVEALRHRMMISFGQCVQPEWTWDAGTETGSFDMTAFEEHIGPAFNGTLYKPGAQFNTYRTPYGGSSDLERMHYWRELAAEFKARGWFDKMYLYLPDEPNPSEYPRLVELAALLHEADPDLRAMATEQIEEALIGSVDIWCPDEPLFSDAFPGSPGPEDYPPRQALGEDVWWYNCTSAQVLMDFSNHFVDGQGMYMRIWQWLTRRYNFDGLLFWHTVWLYSKDSDDPWVDQYADRFVCNGDGTMFYPGVPDKIGGTTDIPVPSIRLKLFREGMEDYEYFHILDDMGYSDFVQAEVEKHAFRTYKWEHDPYVIEHSRRRLAALILGELDIDAPAAPTGINATAGIGSLTISWSANSESDIAGYEVSLSRYEGERVVAVKVTDGLETTFDGLEEGKPYYLSVRAYDETENTSPWGEEVSAAPLTAGDDDDDDDNDDNDDAGDNDDDDDDDGCCG